MYFFKNDATSKCATSFFPEGLTNTWYFPAKWPTETYKAKLQRLTKQNYNSKM